LLLIWMLLVTLLEIRHYSFFLSVICLRSVDVI
jgi:hypothetical protein